VPRDRASRSGFFSAASARSAAVFWALLRLHVLLQFFGRVIVSVLRDFFTIKNVGQGSDGLGPKVQCVAQW